MMIEVNDIGALSGTVKKQIEDILRKNREIEKLIESNYNLEKN